ncbi:MAG: SusC/RagA family TonB-linked outer membrane protein [Lutibacter sp.]|uniref:SusC/RagA family TonB-linked outer membrane protein n=1 Tax=Lutibacter sp. TaxID=1925666 RepID=UPI001A016DE3|nr:TonB-dependent receptor [Lutibacter sp.]NOR27362.1 SusC/RagA family TonB-linked outer membrane protein [Lutibacter sp.]
MKSKQNYYLRNHLKKVLVLFLVVTLVKVNASSFDTLKGNDGIKKEARVAQTQVSGIVTDQQGTPLPGVAITIKGVAKGVTTDFDGNYSIAVDEGQTLVFSYIGFATKEVVIGGKKTVNITLQEDVSKLDEVVVIGYGTVKKSDLTGSVSSVKADEIAKMPVQSVDKALQGRAAGVQVKTTSAAPGGSVSVIIRGGNSINSSIQPLYIVDGIPVDENSLNSFNPDDIASIEILKDASSTAVYGSRGSNGVVLITSKRGKVGKTRVQYSSYLKYEQFTKGLNLLNGDEFAEIFNEWLVNTGSNPVYNGDNRYFPAPGTIGEGTDWIDQITKDGFVQNQQVSISGGSEDVRYSMSGNYLKHEGIILGGDFTRGTFKVNTDVKVNDWLSIGNNLNISRNVTNGSGTNTNMESGGGTINAAIKMSPVLPVYDINGNYTANNFPGAQGIENPVANANEIINRNTNDRVVGSLFANLTLLKGLNAKISYGVDIKNVKSVFFESSNTIGGGLVGGRAAIDNSTASHFINENIFTYKKTFGEHKIDLLGGYSREWQISESNGISGVGFPSDALEYNNINSAETPGIPTSWKSKWQLESWISRAKYNYKGKYLFTFTGRYDGSSKLAEGNKWAFFPSGAFAWRLSEESFMKDKIDQISDLKLRLSHGLTGNSNIGLYRSQVILGIGGYPFNEAVQTAVYPSTLGNPDLGWEYTTTSNVGIDIGLFHNRYSVSIDMYKQLTKDLLWAKNLDPISGYASSLTNAGTLENKGIELGLNATIIEGAFKWKASGNISFNRNKITYLDDEANQWKVGLPVGVFRGKKEIGIFRDWDDVNNYVDENGAVIMPNAEPGDVKFADLGGAFDANGNPVGDGKITGEDAVILGDPNPDFIFGLTNNFSYKAFDLSIFIQGSQGNDIKNSTGSYLHQVTNMRNNLSRDVLDRWTPENPDGKFMKIGGTGAMSSIEDASYIKLQNVNFTYNIPVSKLKLKAISAAKIYVSGQNLLTITNYSGFDPDVNTGGKSATNLGVDNSAYPMPRVYTMGINVTF